MSRERKSYKESSVNYNYENTAKHKIISGLSVRIVAFFSILLIGVFSGAGRNKGMSHQTDTVEAQNGSYTPLSQLPEDYTPETAEKDGCFVIVEGEICGNKEALLRFAEKARLGKPSRVRIVNYFEELGNEALITDVYYDGKIYHYYHDETRVGAQEQSVWSGAYTCMNIVEDAELFYLANDHDVTYDEYKRSLVSCYREDMIDQATLYWGNPSFEMERTV